MNLYDLHYNPGQLLLYDELYNYSDVLEVMRYITGYTPGENENEIMFLLPIVIDNHPDMKKVIERLILEKANQVEGVTPFLIFYAEEILMNRWPEAEPIIKRGGMWDQYRATLLF